MSPHDTSAGSGVSTGAPPLPAVQHRSSATASENLAGPIGHWDELAVQENRMRACDACLSEGLSCKADLLFSASVRMSLFAGGFNWSSQQVPSGVKSFPAYRG